MVCGRCGTSDQPIDTFSIRVNDISEYLRTPLCSSCRTVVRRAIEAALAGPDAA